VPEQTTATTFRTVALPDGETIPVLGIGTWGMAERKKDRADESAALHTAVDHGMTVIDTAEMYGDGEAEVLVGEVLRERRNDIFLVSKVLPKHATHRGTESACEASLQRLRTDRLDLYLLHWRGKVPLDETLDAFLLLQKEGKIRHWGVSNFDVDDMNELTALIGPTGPKAAANQVLYNLTRRGIEYDLLPWSREYGAPIIAYSPLEQGRLVKDGTLKATASRHGATPAQVALAWILRQPGVMAIPKASSPERVRENRAALALTLADDDLARLDDIFSPPTTKIPLEMI
jgi:diketogulonate reductase-like aldo/keto reductase